jgi:hypothetical protein
MIISVAYMAQAHQSSKDKSERIAHTKRKRVEQAQVTKQVLHQNCPAWLRVSEAASATNQTTRRYERIAQHIETVKLIYKMALHHGSAFTTAHLINNSIPAFGRSGKWNQMYVRNILRSRAPIGHLETRHGMIEDVFPVIVDPDDWLRVEAVRKARKGSGGAKTGAFVNLFAGSTACAKCGGNMRINTHARSGYRYYECTNHAVLKWCDNKSRYRIDRIEKEVLGDLGWLSVSIPPASPDDLPALSANLETLLAREHRLEKRFQELDDDTLFGVIARQLRELRVAVSDARAHLASAQRVAAVAKADIPSIQDLTDRSEIHTALKARIKRVAFCGDREVLVETPGILLMISYKGDSVIVVAGADDKVAFISQGKVTFGARFPGMPKLDPGLGAEFLKQLNAPGPVQDGLK